MGTQVWTLTGEGAERAPTSVAIERAPTLDFELFDGLRADFGDTVVADLVELFVQRRPQVEDLVRTSRRSQYAELSRLAHLLRGGAAVMSATRLAEIAAVLENRGLAQHRSGTEDLARYAVTEFDRVVAAMRAALEIPISSVPRARL